jgi:CheY-like chemotaxis protein
MKGTIKPNFMGKTKQVDFILLVDDNKADNEFHTIVIEKAGVTNKLECIPNSRKALEYLTKSLTEKDEEKFPVPDLVFLDINMPAMNGFEMMDKLRAVPDPYDRKKMMKIFMLTGSLNPDDYKLASEKYGDIITGFRIKPLLDSIFKDIVEHYYG